MRLIKTFQRISALLTWREHIAVLVFYILIIVMFYSAVTGRYWLLLLSTIACSIITMILVWSLNEDKNRGL